MHKAHLVESMLAPLHAWNRDVYIPVEVRQKIKPKSCLSLDKSNLGSFNIFIPLERKLQFHAIGEARAFHIPEGNPKASTAKQRQSFPPPRRTPQKLPQQPIPVIIPFITRPSSKN
jgi:hypothetical protein